MLSNKNIFSPKGKQVKKCGFFEDESYIKNN
jgi:hypothetical protein